MSEVEKELNDMLLAVLELRHFREISDGYIFMKKDHAMSMFDEYETLVAMREVQAKYLKHLPESLYMGMVQEIKNTVVEKGLSNAIEDSTN